MKKVKNTAKGTRSIVCIHCFGGFDEKKGETVGNRAMITDWEPARGLDPRLREFQCENCKKMTYKLLHKELEE